MYEETIDTEFGIDFNKVFEPKRGSKMVMAKKKNVLKQPTKAKMVEAIINLEAGLEQLFNKITVLDDALRQYVAYKKDGEKFQKALDVLYKERQEAIEDANAKAKSESSGGSASTSEE